VNRAANVGSSVRGVFGKNPTNDNPVKAEGPIGGPAAAGLVARTSAADGSLMGEIDWAGVGVLNSQESDSVGTLRGGGFLSSEDGGDPEVLLLIPFQAPVKLQAMKLEAKAGKEPSCARFFANQRNLDMGDAAGGVAPTQKVEPVKWVSQSGDVVTANIELNFLKFQNLGFVAVYFSRGDEVVEDSPIAFRVVSLTGRI